MPSSDSEGFESADEGHSNMDKKERKKRNSSSNYSDNALESDGSAFKTSVPITTKEKTQKQSEVTDGWDDFDIEAEVMKQPTFEKEKSEDNPKTTEANKKTKDVRESQDTGWDDFDDWGDDNVNDNKEQEQKSHVEQQLNVKEVTERLAAATTGSRSSNPEGSGGWGWGWGVDSLLSSATAGISTITNQVSQGITTVLESGIGAPDPEELARKKAKEDDSSEKEEKSKKLEDKLEELDAVRGDSGDGAFPFGSILKFVGDTGSKVITGGLDTLETIGRKTMEVLQDGDPRLAKKRAMLGLNTEDKPVLSQVLREAKAKAEEEDRIREEKREAKEVHYENLFDDFEGLVHLEALEMLSKQVSMRIDEQMRQATPDKRQEMKETFQQIAELCEMPEEDEEEIEEDGEELSKPDAFHERLQRATQDLGVKLQFQPLVKQYTDVLEWMTSQDLTMKSVNKKAISSLAQTTALSVEVYHKAAEMLLVKTRRSTADEADAMTQMTAVLTKHTSEMATLFTEKLNSISKAEDSEQCNTFITNIFLEAGNSSTYIQNAFQLAQPIIQIGAV